MGTETRIVTTSGGHNCGGRCLFDVYVENGRAVKIRGSERTFGPDNLKLTPCSRAGSYIERLNHPDRLKYPLRRTGRRGEGSFERISWDEALDTVASELTRISSKYGPQSRWVNYATGSLGKLAERMFFKRLLALTGGYLDSYNTYSNACTVQATPYTYGTAVTASSRDTWFHSKLIILWGHNPVETIFGTGTGWYLKEAKKRGARIIVIDPRRSDSAKTLADWWIPVRPTTDNALMDAMTWVMITENIYNREFVEKFCIGFDEESMPEGIAEGHSLSAYVLGTHDGVAKTPEWAEAICGVPADDIRKLAREFALSKPAALVQGWGPQRHAYGEQPARGATVLAAITGNVGIDGGWASGAAQGRRVPLASVVPENPVKASIPIYIWPDAIEKGTSLGADDGLVGADKLDSNIKFIANLAGNIIGNQHSDINATAELLADESKCEFILVADEFMTNSARLADIVLPSTNFMERIDILESGNQGRYAVFLEKIVEPEFERRTGYDWIAEIADRIGLGSEFREGRSYEDWARYVVAETQKRVPDFPDFEKFRRESIYFPESGAPYVAFREQIEDPANNPFPTPSGKIELFSERLYRMNKPDVIPAVPKYVPAWEGPEDPLIKEFPLQLIAWHSKRSAHSTFANLERAEKVVAMHVSMNTQDAAARGIGDGDLVRIFNSRGEVRVPAKVSDDIMAGVAALPQGGWPRPDASGADRGGCINTLTKYQPTPLAKGNPQHTNLAEIEKV